jgi:hypothetical protein
MSMTVNWSQKPMKICETEFDDSNKKQYYLCMKINCNLDFRLFFLSFFFILISPSLWSQVTISGSTGANGTYSTLKASFDAINANGTQGGKTIVILITGNTTETATASLNQSSVSSWVSLSIRPSGGAARLITGNLNNAPIVNLNGADNVTIDGLNTGGNSLIIRSTRVSAGASTLRFILDASNNTITNCTIEGSSTGATTGTVLFSTGSVTGNDNNIISNNTIGPAGVNLPANAIYSAGSSVAIDNSNNSIITNNIQDYFNASGVSNGAFIASNSSAWTLLGNKFFQTATRTATTGTTRRAINIVTASGVGYVISNNIIGYANASSTGITVYNGTVANLYRAIEITCSSSGSLSAIDGNTIAGINFATSSGSTALPGIFSGISVLAGNVTIGSNTGNTIGAATGTGSITITSTVTSGVVTGVYSTSSGTVTVANNNIGAIDTGGGNTIGNTFHGINTAGTGSYAISSNLIGSASTLNSISIGTVSTTTGVCVLNGINNLATGMVSITNNTVKNVTAYGTALSQLTGILNSAGSGAELAITGNNIIGFNNRGTNTIIGISNTAATAALTNITGNTIRSSSFAGTGGFIGILNGSSQPTISINNNIIRDISRTTATGSVTGISSTGVVSVALNINGNQFGNTDGGFVSFDVASSGTLVGITISGASTLSAQSIQSNDFRGIVHTLLGTGTHTYIINASASNSQNISNNTFTNLNVNTTGDITLISNNVSLPAGGTQNINNNSIVTAFARSSTATSGILTLFTSSTAVSVSGSTINNNNNNFSNISVSGAASIAGWINTDAANGTKNIKNNTFSNWTGVNTPTGNFTGISVNTTGTNNEISGNQINTFSGGGNLYGIITAAGNDKIFSNIVHTLISTSAIAATVVNGVAITSGTSKQVYQNSIYNIQSNGGFTTGNVSGISVTGGLSNLIFGNKIYNISSSNGVITTGSINGIMVSGAVANQITTLRNNSIGGIIATAASAIDPMRGINIANSGLNSTTNVYFNTIYLNALASSGTNCGSSAVYHAANAVATTGTLDLRNNIIINQSIPKGTGITAALRRSGTALNNFATASNNNLYHAGTPSVFNLVYYNGTNSSQTLVNYQGIVSPREMISVYEDLVVGSKFLSVTGLDLTYLHLDPTKSNLVESTGVAISGIDIDYDGNIRQGSLGYTGNGFLPDIGADEFEGVLPDVTWDGGASTTLWGDALNWKYDFVPGASHNVSLTGANTININTNAQTKSLTLNNSGLLLTILTAKSLVVAGNLTMTQGTLNTESNFPTVSGTVTLSSGTVSYTATGNQTISPQAYYNLTFNGSGIKTIPATVNHIFNNVTVGGTASVSLASKMSIDGNLTVSSSASFAIGAGETLTVSGAIANAAGSSGLVLKSDATGTASLMHNSNNIPATVQRYISGAAETWHFLSSPVSNQAIAGSWLPAGTYGNGTGYDLYLWNEPTFCWKYKLDVTSVGNWNTVHPGSNFSVGRGYLYSVQTASPTKDFIGNLNNGILNYPVTKTNTSDLSLESLEGFTLIGNPYPSSIDWKASSGWARTNLENSAGGYDMWIWNPIANNYGICNSATGIGTNGITRYIAPMQGYFVKAASSGNLGIDNSVRVHTGAGNWLKNATKKNGLLRITVQSEVDSSSDEVLIQFGFPESKLGARKLFSHVISAPSLYLMSEGESYSVRYLTNTADNRFVPVSFKSGSDGYYTLKCNFDANEFDFVLLEDRLLKSIKAIKAESSYRFKVSKADETNRFVLHFTAVENTVENVFPAKIYSDGTHLIVDLTSVNCQTEVIVHDIQGRLLLRKKLQGSTKHSLNMDLASQVIIVRLLNEIGELNCKVLHYKWN